MPSARTSCNFKDYDKSLRATWKFLRSATAEQVSAQVTRIFEADDRLVNGTIFNRLLNPAPVLNEWQHTCYGLWSADGMVPARLPRADVRRHPHPLPHERLNQH